MPQARVGGDSLDVELVSNQVSLTWPGGLASGMFAVVTGSYYENGEDGGLNTPTGFTPMFSSLVLSGSGTTESRFEGFYREMNGSESGALVVGRSGLGFYMTALLDIYQGNGALTFVSATAGTPATGTTSIAPNVAGTSGQLQLALFGSSDPTTMTDPSDGVTTMSAGQQGVQDVNTGRNFYKFLSADMGAMSTTLGTSRGHVGISVLVNDAGSGGGGARKIILTRPA
jgi:hypothetical protein